MRSLYVFADFDFLPSPAEIGVLNYERVRGNEVFSFEYWQDWLEKYSGITLGKDLFQTPGKQYAQGGLFGCFSDALPDRWGRTLAIKREAIEAQKEKRPPRRRPVGALQPRAGRLLWHQCRTNTCDGQRWSVSYSTFPAF